MKRLRTSLSNIGFPIIATLLGLMVSSLFVLSAGTPPLDTFTRLFCEGFGPRECNSFSDLIIVDVTDEDTGEISYHFAPFYGPKGHTLSVVLERAIPLILTAMAATVAFKAGMFSIGMDGQLVLGALIAVFIGYWLPARIYAIAGIDDPETVTGALFWSMRLTIPVIAMTAAAMVGAAYSWVAGFLKVRLDVNELISTIILNAIAVQFVGYMINFPMRADMNNIARTERIDDTAWLVPFTRELFSEIAWFKGSRLGIGIVIALLAGVVIWFFLWRSTAGYEQRMVQGARGFARFGGVPAERAILRAMLISGALSGLAGSLQILGVERRIVDGFAASGTGFDGVLIAILARESIVGIFFVATLFAGLDLGATNLQFGNIPRQLGGMIIALVILFNSMEDFLRDIFSRIRARIAPIQPTDETAPAAGGD